MFSRFGFEVRAGVMCLDLDRSARWLASRAASAAGAVSIMTTRSPSSARQRTVARPMPSAATVTTAVRPALIERLIDTCA